MNIRLVLKSDNYEFSEKNILRFVFTKDSYVPYTSLSIGFITEHTSFAGVSEILLYINDHLVHHGLVDSLNISTNGAIGTVSVISRGFTSLLCQNQIEPGMKTGVSINSLMNSYYSFPYVTHEDNPDTSNYIYLKKSSSMWDGIVTLSYKLFGTYPYIRGANCVRLTAVDNPNNFAYKLSELLSTGSEIVCRRMVSDIHMSDINGEFGSYELNDSSVSDQKIIRHKYIDLDRRFLHSPESALEYQDSYASRGWRRSYCTYSGYSGEDLSDTLSFGTVSGRISSVEIRGSSSGVITELSVYYDKFRNR